MCYSVTALYRRVFAVTDFETRVTFSKQSGYGRPSFVLERCKNRRSQSGSASKFRRANRSAVCRPGRALQGVFGRVLGVGNMPGPGPVMAVPVSYAIAAAGLCWLYGRAGCADEQ